MQVNIPYMEHLGLVESGFATDRKKMVQKMQLTQAGLRAGTCRHHAMHKKTTDQSTFMTYSQKTLETKWIPHQHVGTTATNCGKNITPLGTSSLLTVNHLQFSRLLSPKALLVRYRIGYHVTCALSASLKKEQTQVYRDLRTNVFIGLNFTPEI